MEPELEKVIRDQQLIRTNIAQNVNQKEIAGLQNDNKEKTEILEKTLPGQRIALFNARRYAVSGQ
jgi:hypothetical protein